MTSVAAEDKLERPTVSDRFAEDPTWMPSDEQFRRHGEGADLGLLFTDGSYDIIVYESIGSPAVQAFDTLRMGLNDADTTAPPRFAPLTRGFSQIDDLDADQPLFVLGRRGDQPFAAVQSWELAERLMQQDRPRRLSGSNPAPSLVDVDDSSRHRLVGLGIRLGLLIVAVAFAAVVALATLDTGGPVAFWVVDRASDRNPIRLGAELAVDAGDRRDTVALPGGSSSGLRPLESIRWSLDAPLTISFSPAEAGGTDRHITLNLRENGATILNRGQTVRIRLVFDDEFVTVSVFQPIQDGFTLRSALVHEVAFPRERDEASAEAESPPSPPGEPRTQSPQTSAEFDRCVRDAVDTYLPLRNDLDLAAQYSGLIMASTDSDAFDPQELARQMQIQAEDLRALLESSGLLASRPSESPIPEFFEGQFARQAELADAWSTIGGAGAADQIDRAERLFRASARFLNRLRTLLNDDALIICRTEQQ